MMVIYPSLILPLTTSKTLPVFIIQECFILLPILLVFNIIKKENPKYPFQIYENGFVYPTKIKGADKTTNYLGFVQIERIAFERYGDILAIKIKGAGIAIITPKWAFESYFVLCRLICKKMNYSNCPDFDLLEKMCLLIKEKKPIDAIKEKNKDFQYVPSNFK
jgi:hypothetical protein